MNKRIFAALAAMALALTLTACGDKAKEAADAAKASAEKAAVAAKEAAGKAADAAKAAATDAATATKEAADKAADATKDAAVKAGDASKDAAAKAPSARKRRMQQRRRSKVSLSKQHSGTAGTRMGCRPFAFTARRLGHETVVKQAVEGLRTAACRAIQRVSGFHCSQSCSPRERGRSNTE